MHDVIRDMALWIACNHGVKTRFLVNDSSKTSGLQVFNHAKWEEVERLSLWGNRRIITDYFSQDPRCPNLVTLLFRDVRTTLFTKTAFFLTSTIRVLDLSGSRGISHLLSTIGDLVDLQHLNLSYTDIMKLPKELKNLKKLRFLVLDGLEYPVLPEKVISSLLSLQALSIRGCNVINENVLLHELEGLDHLQDIRICVSIPSSIEKILISSKLQRCMCELLVQQCSLPHDLFSALGKMEHLESLIVEGNKISKDTQAVNMMRSSFWKHEYTIILRHLRLEECHDVLDLNWLINAPNLEVLELVNCHLLKEIISEDFGTTGTEIVKNNLFSNLTSLYLESLNNLRSICRMTSQFPSLKEVQVKNCPNLKKLPFDSQSALKNLRFCVGDRDWFHQLQWEDEDTKNLLSSKF